MLPRLVRQTLFLMLAGWVARRFGHRRYAYSGAHRAHRHRRARR